MNTRDCRSCFCFSWWWIELCTLLSLAEGAVLNLTHDTWANKGSSEHQCWGCKLSYSCSPSLDDGKTTCMRKTNNYALCRLGVTVQAQVEFTPLKFLYVQGVHLLVLLKKGKILIMALVVSFGALLNKGKGDIETFLWISIYSPW